MRAGGWEAKQTLKTRQSPKRKICIPAPGLLYIWVDSMSEELKKQLLITAGTLSLVIGIVGIFVPLLPTTPFLLLAAGCYLRSSQKFYNWLMSNRFLGAYIRNYFEGRGIPVKVKLFIIALLWVTIGISIWLVAKPLVTVILLIVAIGVTLHIIFIKTRQKS